jgi:hypothetical protein
MLWFPRKIYQVVYFKFSHVRTTKLGAKALGYSPFVAVPSLEEKITRYLKWRCGVCIFSCLPRVHDIYRCHQSVVNKFFRLTNVFAEVAVEWRTMYGP